MYFKRIVLVTGPSATGKSTISELLTNQLKSSAVIHVDDIKDIMPHAFYQNKAGYWRYSNWREVGKIVSLLITHLRENYDTVIIEGYVTDEVIKNIDVNIDFKILLNPTLGTALERNKHRKPHFLLHENDIERHYHNFAKINFKNFAPIDSTNQTIQETLREILSIIDK